MKNWKYFLLCFLIVLAFVCFAIFFEILILDSELPIWLKILLLG